MSLHKQSDVKNHMSNRTRSQIHLIQPVSQPDATGFSEVEPGPAESPSVSPAERTVKTDPAIQFEALRSFLGSNSSNVVPSSASKSVQD
jgi:hypothetical protein